MLETILGARPGSVCLLQALVVVIYRTESMEELQGLTKSDTKLGHKCETFIQVVREMGRETAT